MKISKKYTRGSSGFGLVEILVVMAVMGIVVMAIYGLFQKTQRTANTSEEVVEVQQNLRVALDIMARDIRMAGYLVSGAPISPANANDLTLRTASSEGKYARISADETIQTTEASQSFTVSPATMTDLFSVGDFVRIIRPRNYQQPIGNGSSFEVDTIASPNITLDSFTPPAADADFLVGDIIVGVPSAAAVHPNTISYSLIDDPNSADANMKLLVRNATGAANQVVASKIRTLTFSYKMKDGSFDAGPVDADKLEDIVAVRIILAGATDLTMTGNAQYSGEKLRTVDTVVKLRNF